MLAVDETGSVDFHRGYARDRFKIGEDGIPVCVTEGGVGLSYIISGPLTEDQFELECQSDVGWSKRPQRIHSVRRSTSAAFGGERVRTPIGGND